MLVYQTVKCSFFYPRGEETSVTLNDLKPATDYHARVQAEYNSMRGTPSEAESFTTLSCEPDIPNPPRIANRTKNSLTLQWKAPSDNGSKIQSFILEWDEVSKLNLLN